MSDTSFWKWRLRVGGPLMIVLGSVLMALRGFSHALLVLPVIGVVVLAIGLVIK